MCIRDRYQVADYTQDETPNIDAFGKGIVTPCLLPRQSKQLGDNGGGSPGAVFQFLARGNQGGIAVC